MFNNVLILLNSRVKSQIKVSVAKIYLPDTENGIGTVISGSRPQKQYKG